ncbi:MAG: hypothetical protein AAF141_15510 [Pseudomonadota bacterium]
MSDDNDNLENDENELDAKIAAAVDAAVEGLKNKNGELIADKKGLKDELNSLKAKLAEADNAASEKDEAAARANQDMEKLEATLNERHGKELSELKASIEAKDAQLQSLVIGNGLKDALVAVNVSKPLMPAAEALLRSSTEITIEDVDGKPTAMVSGTALAEFVQTWSQSDEGKHFVSAGGNTGAGAKGVDGSGRGLKVTKTTRSD